MGIFQRNQRLALATSTQDFKGFQYFLLATGKRGLPRGPAPLPSDDWL